jgi:hypothetical protein
MAVVLVKEDGSGRPDANCYADVNDADAYFLGHVHPDPWPAADQDKRTGALVMATRLIDALFQFNGTRANANQALQWPRERCADPDAGVAVGTLVWWRVDGFVAADVVPNAVRQATCEMARELLMVDRTAAPPGEGLVSVATMHTSHNTADSGSASDSVSTKYSKTDTRPILSAVAQAMLSKYGGLVSGGSGAVRLVRA